MVPKRENGENRTHRWATRGPWMGHRNAHFKTMTAGFWARMARMGREMEPGGHDFEMPWAMKNPRKSLILVRLAGIEPTT